MTCLVSLEKHRQGLARRLLSDLGERYRVGFVDKHHHGLTRQVLSDFLERYRVDFLDMYRQVFNGPKFSDCWEWYSEDRFQEFGVDCKDNHRVDACQKFGIAFIDKVE